MDNIIELWYNFLKSISTMVAQVLGQEEMQSALQYLVLDTGNLKECALNLEGIPVGRREFQ